MFFQESQTNFIYRAADFQTEQELQNAAESGLIEAAEIIPIQFADKLDINKATNKYFLSRKERQYKVEISPKNSERLGKIDIEVYFEYGKIHSELGKYSDAEIFSADRNGIILISVASCKSRIDDKKIYRRSLALIFDDEPKKICFINSL